MHSLVVAEKVTRSQIKIALESLILEFGGLEQYLSKGDRVFIKPNMFLCADPETGLITHPELIVALAEICHSLGAKVVIGERNGNIYNNFQKYPIIYKYAEVVDLDREEIILKDPDGKNLVINFPLPIPKIVNNSDFIINVPGLRTHVLTNISNALKNVMGFLPLSTTRLLHLAGLDEAIVDINHLIKVDLIITDAIYSLEGYFPADMGKPIKTDFIMASRDPVAIDAVAADIMGYIPDDIATIRLASLTGIGVSSLENIKFKTDDLNHINKYKRKFLLPKSGDFLVNYENKLNIYYKNACEKCCRALANGLHCFLEENNTVDPSKLKRVNIVTGQSYKGEMKKGSNLIYGNCAKQYASYGYYIAGCPPLTGEVKNILKMLLNSY